MFSPGISRQSFVCSAVLVAALSLPLPVSAQYYESREYAPLEERFLNVGFVQRDFRPRPTNSTPDSLVIDFKRVTPVLGFHQGSVDIIFGYSTYTLKGSSRSSVFLGVTIAQDVPLSGRKPSALLLPVLISADFTKAEGIGVERQNFNVASVGLGTGLKYRYYNQTVDLSIQLAEVAHYSSEGFGAGSGFSASTLGEVFVLVRRVLMFDGIALGYRLRFQTWSMTDARFDYKSFSHGPFVGIAF